MDTTHIRKDFPILSREVYGKPLVYLDNAATTQKPLCVLDAMREEYLNVNANVHRGVHYLSQQATDLHEAARERVRSFINAASTREIVFTRGTTESMNLVASSFTELAYTLFNNLPCANDCELKAKAANNTSTKCFISECFIGLSAAKIRNNSETQRKKGFFL